MKKPKYESLRVGIVCSRFNDHIVGALLDGARRGLQRCQVGDADIDVVSGAIKVNVGTGNLRIKTALANAGEIKGTTGVGSTSLKGLEGTVKSNAVGGRVSGHGGGQQPIDATVGVGDLSIELDGKNLP